MGLPLWLVTGCAALVGLAVGYWLAGTDREKLRKAAAAKVKEAEDRARALDEKEQALSQKVQEAEETEHTLTERLRDLEHRQKAVVEKQARLPMKGKRKAAKAKKGHPEKTPPESA